MEILVQPLGQLSIKKKFHRVCIEAKLDSNKIHDVKILIWSVFIVFNLPFKVIKNRLLQPFHTIEIKTISIGEVW